MKRLPLKLSYLIFICFNQLAYRYWRVYTEVPSLLPITVVVKLVSKYRGFWLKNMYRCTYCDIREIQVSMSSQPKQLPSNVLGNNWNFHYHHIHQQSDMCGECLVAYIGWGILSVSVHKLGYCMMCTTSTYNWKG